MKKLIYVLIAVFALTSCREDPDLGDLSSDFLVFTNYDGKADFNRFTRYYMPDSVMVIGDTKDPEYWTGSKAADILKAYEDNMQACGYVRTDDKSEADVGLQISYVQSVAYFVDYRNPYWWNEYPGYWLPGYWGDWGYWYYPYPVVYSYSVGSLLTEMVDLSTSPSADRKLTVVWNSFLSGLLSGSDAFNMELTVGAINQSFVQSPYLVRSAAVGE